MFWDKFGKNVNDGGGVDSPDENKMIDLFDTFFKELLNELKEIKKGELEPIYSFYVTLTANGEYTHKIVQGSKPKWWILQNVGANDVYFVSGEKANSQGHIVPADKLFHYFPASKIPVLSFRNSSASGVASLVVTATSISPNLY